MIFRHPHFSRLYMTTILALKLFSVTMLHLYLFRLLSGHSPWNVHAHPSVQTWQRRGGQQGKWHRGCGGGALPFLYGSVYLTPPTMASYLTFYALHSQFIHAFAHYICPEILWNVHKLVDHLGHCPGQARSQWTLADLWDTISQLRSQMVTIKPQFASTVILPCPNIK